jgi:SAM-dependent methyltransferase
MEPMPSLSERLRDKLFRREDHPYQVFERRINSIVRKEHVLVDAGCGRSAPLIATFVGKVDRAIGVELVDFTPAARESGVKLLNNDLARIELESESVDVVISRSVLEHIKDIQPVYAEVRRILKPGGRFLFLVPNFWDYVSVISFLVPNRFHAFIVAKTEGRSGIDTFPTFYKSNTRSAIARLAADNDFEIRSFEYLGQYPSMLMFNPALFLVGTIYEKVIARVRLLNGLRGWLLVELRKGQ